MLTTWNYRELWGNKMRHLLTFLASVLLIVGCASTNHGPHELFKAYSQYKMATSDKNIEAIADQYFSRSLLGDKYRTNPDATRQLLFKNYMASEESHFEQSNSQEGCLTINGYDHDKEPVIISLKYVSVHERWLIDEIHIALVESRHDFAKEARCTLK
jgi:hypothetical protein